VILSGREVAHMCVQPDRTPFRFDQGGEHRPDIPEVHQELGRWTSRYITEINHVVGQFSAQLEIRGTSASKWLGP